MEYSVQAIITTTVTTISSISQVSHCIYIYILTYHKQIERKTYWINIMTCKTRNEFSWETLDFYMLISRLKKNKYIVLIK